LSVWDNIAFGLRLKRLSAPEIQSRVEQAQWYACDRAFQPIYPVGSSNVALARALVNRPAVVLLDEPWAHSI